MTDRSTTVPRTLGAPGRVRRARLLATAAALLTVLGGLGQAMAQGTPTTWGAPAVLPIAYENISAYSSLSFSTAAFTVAPGQPIHFVITQMSSFAHTFTLSSVANYTNLSTYTQAQLDAFLHAHTPLVNLSLGSTAGKKFYDNITAPVAQGKYEFICFIHYTTMDGIMTDSTGGGGGGGGSSGSSGLSPGEEVGIGVLVAAIAVIAVGLLWRRRGQDPTEFTTQSDPRSGSRGRKGRHRS